MAWKLISFDEMDAESVVDEMKCELYKSADPAWDVTVAIMQAFVGDPGADLARAQVVKLLPKAGHAQTAKGLIGQLKAWREANATRWFSPAVMKEIDVLVEVVGDMSEGALDITKRLQTPFLKDNCLPLIYNLVSAQVQTKEKGKVQEIVIYGPEAAADKLKALELMGSKASQDDLDKFSALAWALPSEMQFKWNELEKEIAGLIGGHTRKAGVAKGAKPVALGGSSASTSTWSAPKSSQHKTESDTWLLFS